MATTDSKKKRREEIALQKRSKYKTNIEVIVLFAAAALAFGGWYVWSEENRPGQSVQNLGRAHVPAGSLTRRYKSSPPTSGPHAGPSRWGNHTVEIPNINQVHNLEHGGVLIQYNCEHEALRGRCGQAREPLRRILRTAREEIDSKIILAPYSQMNEAIALTAWRRVQYFSEPDAEAILSFIHGNINRAPE